VTYSRHVKSKITAPQTPRKLKEKPIVFTLRPYQQQVVSDTYAYIRQGEKKILIFAPTGAGKTVIITKVVFDASSRAKKVLFVVHREILIEQTAKKFAAVGLECGFIKAGWPKNIDAGVQIASVQTLPKRDSWKLLKFDLVIFDECHLVAFSKICQEIREKLLPEAIYLGLTATPWRLSKRESLGDVYSALVCAPMPKILIESSFLVKPSYFGLSFNIELDNVNLVNGDYDLNQLSVSCDRPELIEQICQTWCKLAQTRPTIAFAVKVAHANNIAKAFSQLGVSANVVSGTTPISVRNELYRKLADGELKILVSCNALSEGFDVPQVSCVILARPTKSKALYFQQVGRGLRLAQNKDDCLVLDQSGNVLEHGFVEDLEEVTLETSKANNTKNKKGKPPLKICPLEAGGCGIYVASVVLKCPQCQYNFDLAKLVTNLNSGRLISQCDLARMEKYRSLLREGYQNNFAPSWAAVKFRDEFGFFPPFDWAKSAIFNDNQEAFAVYNSYLSKTACRLNKDLNWIQKYLNMEFGWSGSPP
jgi:superfamily II DNA or RNA helicase